MANAIRDLVKTAGRAAALEQLLAAKRQELPPPPKKTRKAKPSAEPSQDDWASRALARIKIIKPGARITADDLDLAMGSAPRHRNVRGQVFQTAAAMGLLKDTGSTVPASAPQARGRRIRVWERA